MIRISPPSLSAGPSALAEMIWPPLRVVDPIAAFSHDAEVATRFPRSTEPANELDASRMNELMPIALLRSDDLDKRAVRQALDQMAHASVEFDTATDLLAALRAGRRFGLLLLAPQGPWNWSEWQAAVADGIPMLLMVQDLAQSPLPAEGGPGGMVDFIALSSLQVHELQWRVRSLLAKSLATAHTSEHPRLASGKDELTWNNYHFLPRNRVVHCRGQEIRLRPREYDLALLMFFNMDLVLERQWLRSALWSQSARKGSRALDTCVSNIRKKLALNAGNGLELRSLHGRGYRLVPMQPDRSQTDAFRREKA
jgi:two-component system phosphate regulon response regulator PhoB